jgi:uncharacterized protein YgiB involved in biofilm formation
MGKRFDLALTGALASALLLAGCQRSDSDWIAQRNTAVCVDRTGMRVPDADCQSGYASPGGGGNAFLWYYLGRSSTIPTYGGYAYGGGYTRTAGATYFHAPVATAVTESAAISRGGFGSSAHSFGGAGE